MVRVDPPDSSDGAGPVPSIGGYHEVQKIVGVRFAPTVPVRLARLIMGASWKYFGSLTHPSWLDVMFADFTLSNARLKSTGWRPKYNSVEALRSAFAS
ncbi:hypothetical protein [[Eubacterium] cellulosolvens]